MTELRGEAERVFNAQQATQNILLCLRDTAVWRNGFAYLMQGVMTPAPAKPT
ncbi:hypothetical protein [Citrobacter telavivensis]